MDIQYRHLLSLNNVDEILFGNSYASETEFKALNEIDTYIADMNSEPPEMLKMFKFKNKHILKLDLDIITNPERKEL